MTPSLFVVAYSRLAAYEQSIYVSYTSAHFRLLFCFRVMIGMGVRQRYCVCSIAVRSGIAVCAPRTHVHRLRLVRAYAEWWPVHSVTQRHIDRISGMLAALLISMIRTGSWIAASLNNQSGRPRNNWRSNTNSSDAHALLNNITQSRLYQVPLAVCQRH